jgi:hypothetical protein
MSLDGLIIDHDFQQVLSPMRRLPPWGRQFRSFKVAANSFEPVLEWKSRSRAMLQQQEAGHPDEGTAVWELLLGRLGKLNRPSPAICSKDNGGYDFC